MKVKTLFMASLAAVSLCSCGKEDTSWRDALLNEVAGEYHLVGYGWQGPSVDVNGDGKAEADFLPWFLDVMGGTYWKESLKMDVTVTSDRFWEGRAAGRFPSSCGINESSWPTLLSFKYAVTKDGLSFSDAEVFYGAHEDNEILTILSDPGIEFAKDNLSADIRYITVNCSASVYDYLTDTYVAGTVALTYVTSPYFTEENRVVTVQGATADGMVTYTYDLKAGK